MLIIDDNTDIRAYVRSIFEKEYQVLEAVDGRRLNFISILQFISNCDLMIRMDGFGFCHAF